jgi:IclR family KDG regulon transcriptional repressor
MGVSVAEANGAALSTVQSVERASQLLLALGECPQGAALSELSLRTGLHKSTARRLLLTLSSVGLVRQVPPDDHYTLGARVPALGRAAQVHLLIGPAAHGILVELRDQTTETVHLAVPDRFEIVYLEKVESHQSVQAASRVGYRAPLYCTGLGKAYLAFQPSDVRAEYIATTTLIRRTPTTFTDPAMFVEELAKIRRRGYATDDEENEGGVRCVAAPVLNASGVSVAAISLMAPAGRLSKTRMAKMGELVNLAAMKLARSAGADN